MNQNNSAINLDSNTNNNEVEHPEVISDDTLEVEGHIPLKDREDYEGQFDDAAATEEEIEEYIRTKALTPGQQIILNVMLSPEEELASEEPEVVSVTGGVTIDWANPVLSPSAANSGHLEVLDTMKKLVDESIGIPPEALLADINRTTPEQVQANVDAQFAKMYAERQNVFIVADTPEYVDVEVTGPTRWTDLEGKPIDDGSLVRVEATDDPDVVLVTQRPPDSFFMPGQHPNDGYHSHSFQTLEPAADYALSEVAERAELRKKIDDFYHLLDMPPITALLDSMDNRSLRDHLYLLDQNNGGSFSVAQKLQETEIEYDRLLKSDVLRLRMDLLEHKGADVITLMQKMRTIIGNDFVINNVRTADYHNMLKSAVSFISVMHDKISELGSRLGIKMPLNELRIRGESIPVVEGMPADPRVAMYVLNVMITYIDKFQLLTETANKQAQRDKIRIDFLEKREVALNKTVEAHRLHAATVNEQLERFTADSSYWIVKDQKGNILRAIDPDRKPTNVRDLDLRGDYDNAMQFLSKTGARTWADRLMSTKRFRGRQLSIYRVSVVEDK
jgi:hypothetical protein